MERHPKTFSKLSEPEIRDFFLVILNSHFKGTATGETFNNQGKTDVLIRQNNENVFIAECKFWDGQKKLNETVNQLMRYVTWRDSKTAIFLFNKNRNFSTILNNVNSTIYKHPNYKSDYFFTRGILRDNRSVFGYVFKHPLDENQKFLISILAFDIPK